MKRHIFLFIFISSVLSFLGCAATDYRFNQYTNKEVINCVQASNKSFIIFCNPSRENDLSLSFKMKSESKVDLYNLDVLIKCIDKNSYVIDEEIRNKSVIRILSEEELNTGPIFKEYRKCEYYSFEILNFNI